MNRIIPLKNKKTGLIIFFFTVAILYSLSFVSALWGAPETEITDVSIRDAVEDRLSMDEAVKSGPIDVRVEKGVVTLGGKVDNILSRERSADIASTVKGVTGIINDIEVVPVPLEDWQIKYYIKEAMLNDPVAASYEISVDVKDKIATLEGTVKTWKEAQICEKVAKSVEGVKDVANNIKIKSSENRSDLEIIDEIKGILKWDVAVNSDLISVSFDNGIVRLTGVVGSAMEKKVATEDSFVKGVTFVDNSGLKVRDWSEEFKAGENKDRNISEKEIIEAVENALQREPRISLFNIDVAFDSEADEIKLRGTVNNLKAKETAEKTARNIVGVHSVDNRIKVRPAETISDQSIENNVEKALERDPYLDNYNIMVKVSNGVVKLYGDVDSVFEKTQAEEAASGISGIIEIDNALVVRDFSNTYVYDPWVNDSILYDHYWYDNMPVFPGAADAAIEKEISRELFWSPYVNRDQVNVKVDNGIATLTGKVGSWLEYDDATRSAYRGGAIYVKNDLKVE